MRIFATALTTAALAVLPVHAATSAPNAAAEQIKPEAGAAQLNQTLSDSATSPPAAAVSTKKPLEETATDTETDRSAGPKPEPAAQADASERQTSPAES